MDLKPQKCLSTSIDSFIKSINLKDVINLALIAVKAYLQFIKSTKLIIIKGAKKVLCANAFAVTAGGLTFLEYAVEAFTWRWPSVLAGSASRWTYTHLTL